MPSPSSSTSAGETDTDDADADACGLGILLCAAAAAAAEDCSLDDAAAVVVKGGLSWSWSSGLGGLGGLGGGIRLQSRRGAHVRGNECCCEHPRRDDGK